MDIEFLPISNPGIYDSKENDISFTNNSFESFGEKINLSPCIFPKYNSSGDELLLKSSLKSIHLFNEKLDEDQKSFFCDNSNFDLLNIHEENDTTSNNIFNQSLKKKKRKSKKKLFE